MRNRRSGPLAALATLIGAVLTLGIVLTAAPAQADDGNESDRTVSVLLKDAKSGDTPVEGATITVTTADGDTFEGTTDSEGKAEIKFTNPVGKAFTVALDEDTLPEGAELREGARSELKVTSTLSSVRVDFAIGPDNRNVQGKLDRIPRSIYNGLLFGLIAMMIVSIGLQFLLRNVYAYITSSRLQNYDEFLSPEGHDFFGLFTYTVRDIVIGLVSIAVLVSVILALSFTRLGRATRAVADNPALAAASGINVDRVISLVWMVGTALAALAGSFLAFQLGVTYQIGQLVLLLLFAAVCVGGLGSVWGALVGSLIIGVLIELSTLVIPADLKTAGALFLLIVILLVRPQGLLGRPERVG